MTGESKLSAVATGPLCRVLALFKGINNHGGSDEEGNVFSSERAPGNLTRSTWKT